MSEELRIGEVARRTGVSVATIRFYEDEGLVVPTRRTPSGYRLYDEESVARIRFIRRAKALDLRLADIKEILQTPDAGSERTALRHRVAHKLADIHRQLGELEELEHSLERFYVRLVRQDCSCRHVGDCSCREEGPSAEETTMMVRETETVRAATCTCASDGTGRAEGGCGCCGVEGGGWQDGLVTIPLTPVTRGR